MKFGIDSIIDKQFVSIFFSEHWWAQPHTSWKFGDSQDSIASVNYRRVKKESPTQVFSCEICEIIKNTFVTEHLSATAFSIRFTIT